VQNFVDENNHKAFNVGLYARPDALHGLQVGFSVYNDLLTPTGKPNISQDIFSAYAVFVRPTFEFLNEVVEIRNAPAGSPQVFHSNGFYSQISRRFGSWRPYFRYQYFNASAAEPILGSIGRRNGPTFGLRYDMTDFAAVKFQYDRTDRRLLDPINLFGLQFAFTF